jgi:hypothetical protein
MKRLEQAEHNQLIIDKISRTVSYSYRIPSYKTVRRILEKRKLVIEQSKLLKETLTLFNRIT